MEYYSVKEAARMLSVNDETVRRWIREGKIQAERGIGKQGSKITSVALVKFLEINRGLITSLAASMLGLSPNGVADTDVVEMTGALMSTHARKITKLPMNPEAKKYRFRSKNKDKTMIKLEIMQKQFELENLALRLKNDILLKQEELKIVDEQLMKLQEILKSYESGK